MKKKRRKLKIESIIILLLIIIFLLCLIKLIIFLVDIRSNKKQNDDLVNDVISIKTEHNINTGEDEEKITIDFDKLLSINKDTVGWIRFNSDKVNYPIVHTNNNDYYLNRSFDGKINQAGSIFMDYRNTSFDDRNVVLFGHAMIDNSMFGTLKDIHDINFFNTKENNYIQIINRQNEVFIYQIFSYYLIEKEEYYITTSFNNDTEFQTFLNTISSRSYRYFNVEVNINDKILTLSTCVGTGNTSERNVIHAKRIN
ncbi:MAG: class B sortase [Bacilli bacterium]|nr:class B sortase [Bacilli bacterium]